MVAPGSGPGKEVSLNIRGPGFGGQLLQLAEIHVPQGTKMFLSAPLAVDIHDLTLITTQEGLRDQPQLCLGCQGHRISHPEPWLRHGIKEGSVSPHTGWHWLCMGTGNHYRPDFKGLTFRIRSKKAVWKEGPGFLGKLC